MGSLLQAQTRTQHVVWPVVSKLQDRQKYSPVERQAVMEAQMEFEAAFYDEVLNPQKIIPMKQDDDGEDNQDDDFDLIWSNIDDVNSNVNHMNVTTEEVGGDLTVFVEGSLERIHSLQYMGDLFGEKVIVEEDNNKLLIQIPKEIHIWTFSAMDLMATRVNINILEKNVVTIETPIQQEVNETQPFSFTLYYKI